MNHCVPDFEIVDDYAIPTAFASGSRGAGLTRPKKTVIGHEEEIMELLWQNGQVVLQSQNHRSSSFKKSANCASGGAAGGEPAEIPVHQLQSTPTTREIRSFDNINMSNLHHPHQLFMQEDEMASWLHYPISTDDSSLVDHRELYSDDLLYPQPSPPTAPSSPPRQIRSIVSEIRLPNPPPPVATSTATIPPRPPIPPPPPLPEAAAPPSRFQNFTHFSRLPKAARLASGPSVSAREHTVVDSNTVGTESRVSQPAERDSTARLLSGGNVRCGTLSTSTQAVGTSTAARELATSCELTRASSPGASGGSASASASASAEPPPPTVHNPSTSAAEDRKRKGRETDDADCQSEGCHLQDIEFESVDTKKQARGSTSTKRSRAAEVHNLSERRRRDRINDRMRALQELIPRCNKPDKASMLDEAIEYLKSLQLQVQMMSMGCGMLPLMYPGVQQYMPAMGIGMGMGMGMGMEMGMNRPVMPFPSLIPASGMQNPGVAANMGPRFPVPAFHMQPVSLPDSSRIQASNQMDPMPNSMVTNNPSQARMPNFPDLYQQFIGVHQAQVPLPQNQVVAESNKLSSSRRVGNPNENHQPG